MFIDYEDIFGYFDDNNQLLCPECASTLLDLDSISSDQILTRDEAEKEEGLFFCDVHPYEDNQIV